jgi:predicted transcriptional regulator
MAEVFERLKTMEPGDERDELTRLAANQMKLSLMMWSHGSCDNEKVAADLAKYTDGKIQLDLNTFVFNKIMENELVGNSRSNNNRNGNSSNNSNNNKRRNRR